MPQTTRPEYIESTSLHSRRFSRLRKFSSQISIFSTFRNKLLRKFNSEHYDKVFERLRSDNEFQFDPSINLFIQNYRTLPLAARAKLENWSIEKGDINLTSLIDSDDRLGLKSYAATFHGLEVCATIHSSCCEDKIASHRLHQEISAMAQLRHPNVVGFIGASISSTTCIVVTESMSCGSLRLFYLAKQAAKPSWYPNKPQSLAWSLDLARAVNYLHQCEPAILHRDLRPETVFIGSDGALKVSGFGHCSVMTSEQVRTIADTGQQTTTRHICSLSTAAGGQEPRSFGVEGETSAYMAPELHSEPSRADDRADIFSAAVLIAFIRTGHDPHSPVTAGTSRSDHPAKLASVFPWPRPYEASLRWPQLAGVVNRACAPDPENRPSAQGLLEDLEALCPCSRAAGSCWTSSATSGWTAWRRTGRPTVTAGRT